jgi:hypothetical protein
MAKLELAKSSGRFSIMRPVRPLQLRKKWFWEWKID